MSISSNIEDILNKIEVEKQKNGIKYDIKLMTVSKTFPKEDVLEAINYGQILFGENRVLEAYDKYKTIDKDKYDLHIIGHLQRNKAREAVNIASTIESIDKLDTLDALEKYAEQYNKQIGYLIEVNTSNESQKSGINPVNIVNIIDEIEKKDYKFLNLKGLMTVGPLTNDRQQIKKSFIILKNIYDKLSGELKKDDFNSLSMGMSGDFDIAIACGSNQIRIGTAIFGRR